MPAATKDRNLVEIAPRRKRAIPLETNMVIFAGTLACVNAAGNAVKGITSTAIRCVGVFREPMNSTGLAAGTLTAEPEVGVFGPFANSAAGDQITNADVGADCFIVDDATVAKTNGTNTRAVAGKVWSVSSEGVFVDFA